jgi:FAD dependent oxidoreductase TIGR03364
MSQWDIVVVGAGVLGAFHTFWAGRAGLRTLLVERNDWPRDASARNFGMIIPSGMEPGPWHDRSLESLRVYEKLARQLPISDVRRGMTYLAATEHEASVLAEFSRIGPDQGYRCELLDPAEAAQRNPAVRADACRAALHFPDDLILDPPGFFRSLIPWLSERFGTAYRPRATVVRLERCGGECLARLASGEEMRAARVAVCPGVNCSTLFPDIFAQAGVSFTKLQMMRTAPQATVLGTGIATGWTIRRYPSFALAPSCRDLQVEPVSEDVGRFDIHVLMKQDASGAVTIGDSHQSPPDEAALQPTLDMAIDEAILAQARRAVCLPSWEIAARWCGCYPTHPTRSLLRARIDDGIELVVILGGKGMTCAPAVAKETIDSLL